MDEVVHEWVTRRSGLVSCWRTFDGGRYGGGVGEGYGSFAAADGPSEMDALFCADALC